MADISSPQIVSFSNNRVRVIADEMTRLLAALQAFQADYTAFGMGALITAAGNGNNVGDGYVTDGRTPITGLQIQNLKAGIDQLVTAWNVTAIGGVGATVQSVEQAIQVNGSAR